MKRAVPFAITCASGSFMMLEVFVDLPAVKSVKSYLTDFAVILTAFACVPMLLEVVAHEVDRLRRPVSGGGWLYSLVMLGGLATMLGFGIVGGKEDPVFVWLFHFAYVPLESTLLALLAFYIVSAALRAFRARSLEAGILLAAALVVMLGRIPLGEQLSPTLVAMQEWIMDVPNLAAKRAILLGASVGAIATALRVIFGLERLGGAE